MEKENLSHESVPPYPGPPLNYGSAAPPAVVYGGKQNYSTFNYMDLPIGIYQCLNVSYFSYFSNLFSSVPSPGVPASTGEKLHEMLF